MTGGGRSPRLGAARWPVTARWPVVVAAGIAAGAHIWKVPPFVTSLADRFDASLVDVGVLLGTVQFAGLVGGLLVGVAAEAIGLRRCVVGGLALAALASVAGAFSPSFGVLLALRAVESIGVLLVVIAGPGLVRRVADARRLSLASGVWAMFQGLAAFGVLALAAAFAPVATVTGAWLACAAASAAAAAAVLALLPPDPRRGDAAEHARVWPAVRATVRTWGVWVGAVVFLCYAASWMAVLGFLPTILGEAGVGPALANLLTGVASGVNVAGTLLAGILLTRGVSPRLTLTAGACTMAVTSVLVFVPAVGVGGHFAAVLVFSAVGGLVPGTLIRLALALTPEGGSPAAAMGITMQGSNAGLFAGPPAVAALTTATGTWATTWWFTVAVLGAAVALAQLLGARRHGLRLGG